MRTALFAAVIGLSTPAGGRAEALFEHAADGFGLRGPGAAASSDGDDRRTLKRLPENLVRGAGGVFARNHLPRLSLGAAATGIGFLVDDEVRNAIADPEDAWAEFADDYLGATGLGLVSLGLFAGGRFYGDSRFQAMTYDLVSATVVTLGYTAALKAATGRERPDQSNDRAFPSGHAANAFALATVVDAHYGWKLAAPSYVLASLIGVSRLRSDVHWTSDVLAGATLGHVVGRAVVRQNSRSSGGSASRGSPTRISLVLAPGVQGVRLSREF